MKLNSSVYFHRNRTVKNVHLYCACRLFAPYVAELFRGLRLQQILLRQRVRRALRERVYALKSV